MELKRRIPEDQHLRSVIGQRAIQSVGRKASILIVSSVYFGLHALNRLDRSQITKGTKNAAFGASLTKQLDPTCG
jgi:hypothetical protein